MNRQGITRQLLRCLLPMVVFIAAFELTGSLLQILLQTAASVYAPVRQWMLTDSGNVTAFRTALSMAAGLACICGTLRREISLSPAVRSRADVTCVFVVSALSLSLVLNLFFTMSGALASDNGSQAAAQQTGAVSPIMGLLVYGFLSPFAEELVFRGVTFGRLKRLTGSFFSFHNHSQAPRRGKDGREKAPASDAASEVFRESLPAAVMTSLLFAVYHGNLIQGIYAFCMGMVLCAFLEMTGSLPAAAALHGLINCMILFLSQSGLYSALCHVSWLACFAGITVLCGIYIRSRRSGPLHRF